ncbi:hypothetical protein ACFXTN_010738 [Malus domestica]
MASSSTCSCQDILKTIGGPKDPTRWSWISSRNPSPTRKENGQTNSPDVYGHIAPPKDEQLNSKEMATSLDLADEKPGQTITRIVAYQQQFLSSYNKRAKIR